VAIIILTIVEIITFIVRNYKYVLWYDYDVCYYFHYTLDKDSKKMSEMSEKSYSAISKISNEFPIYYDNAGISHFIDKGLAFLIMSFSIIFILIFVTGCCGVCNKCGYCGYIFAYLFCIIGNSICLLQEKSLAPTISLALTSVPKEDIDKDIYESMKNTFDYYYYGRKAWLKFYSIIILFECIIQMILIINYNDDSNFESEHKKKLIPPPLISSSSAEEEEDT